MTHTAQAEAFFLFRLNHFFFFFCPSRPRRDVAKAWRDYRLRGVGRTHKICTRAPRNPLDAPPRDSLPRRNLFGTGAFGRRAIDSLVALDYRLTSPRQTIPFPPSAGSDAIRTRSWD